MTLPRGHLSPSQLGQWERFSLESSEPLPDRIVSKIVVQVGCWEWLGAKTDRGYSHTLLVGKRLDYVHRILYRHFRGAIPLGKQIDHLCRNRSCVNPLHLEIVTNALNTRRGLKAKLTQEQVDIIRQRRASGESIASLAREFDIDSGHCSAICTGYRRMWK